jgi:hypothetical protein
MPVAVIAIEKSARKCHVRNNEPPNTTVTMMQRTTIAALVRRLVQGKRFKRENVGKFSHYLPGYRNEIANYAGRFPFY